MNTNQPNNKPIPVHKHIIRDSVLSPLAKQCEKARKALEEAKKSVKEHGNG